MSILINQVPKLYEAVFNESVKRRVEITIVVMAICAFIVHLAIIALGSGDAQAGEAGHASPIAAIYTPFSFILLYEVFLLIYFLPKSFTASIAKQYEVISLLIARDLFYDIGEVDRGANWFKSESNLYLLLDAVGLLVVFFAIYAFHKLRSTSPRLPYTPRILHFIRIKQVMALALLPSLIGMGLFATGAWVADALATNTWMLDEFKNIDRVFYGDFFRLLIIVDVLILLVSFPFTTSYGQVMRNTGFVVSTILIRLSFTSAPIFDIVLVLSAVAFGYLTLAIYNRIEGMDAIVADADGE